MELLEKNINDVLNKEIEATEGRLTHIKKAIYGDKTGKIKTFAIISPNNPMGESARPEENSASRKRTNGHLGKGWGKEKFKSTLDAGRYQYILQEGKYGDREQSFFIFNISLNSAKSLSVIFAQEYNYSIVLPEVNITMLLQWDTFFWAFFFCFVLNLLSSGLPAWKASRIGIVNAISGKLQ